MWQNLMSPFYLEFFLIFFQEKNTFPQPFFEGSREKKSLQRPAILKHKSMHTIGIRHFLTHSLGEGIPI